SGDSFCATASCQLHEARALARLRHVQTKTGNHLAGTKVRLQVSDEELLRVDQSGSGWTGRQDFASESQCDRGELGCRLAMRESTADRAPIANPHVSDVGDRRSQQRSLASDQF